jgi:hypothetical protein
VVTDGFTPDKRYEICPRRASSAMDRLQKGLPSPFEGHLNNQIKQCILDEGWSFNDSYTINKTSRSRWRSFDGKAKYSLPGAVIFAISKLLGGEDVSKANVVRFANAPNAHLPFIKYNNYSSLMYLSGQFTFSSNHPFEDGRADEAAVEVDLGFKTLTTSCVSETELLWCRAEIGILEAELHIYSPGTEILARYDIHSDPYDSPDVKPQRQGFGVHLWEKDEKSWQILPFLPASHLMGKFQRTLCKIGGIFGIGDRAALLFRPSSLYVRLLDMNSPALSASLANASREKRALIGLLIEEELINTINLVDGCGFELRDPNEAWK